MKYETYEKIGNMMSAVAAGIVLIAMYNTLTFTQAAIVVLLVGYIVFGWMAIEEAFFYPRNKENDNV